MSSIHDGHRQRMRKKVAKNGLSSLEDHELIEMLLYYVHSRCNTNEIAHELVARFSGMTGVVGAHSHEIKNIKGMGEKGAMLFKLISECIRRVNIEENKDVRLTTTALSAKFVTPYFKDVSVEQLHLFCLDIKYRVCDHKIISQGWADSTAVDKRALASSALNSGAYKVLIAHNHPGGEAKPTFNDTIVTRDLIEMFEKLSIPLIDHIIVSDTGYYSFLSGGTVDFGTREEELYVAQYTRG